MSPQDFGLTLALFPSPPSTVPPSPHSNNNNTDSNKSMALGSTTPAPSSPRPELALYYFNSPTMLPHQKKPIPLMPSNTSNVDVMMVPEEDGKGPTAEPAPRKRERSPLPPDSEKGNKRKTPRKMRSSPFLAAATGHFFQAARSLQLSPSSLSAAVTAPATSPKAADGTTGVRNGDTALTSRTTLNASTSNNNNNVNSAEMETVKVISRAVRQRVAQSSSSSTAASAIAVDTAASVRSVEVECTSPTASAPIPPAPSSSSSKSPFKKRRRVERTQRPSSPLRNPPLSASDFPIASSSRAPPSSPAAAPPAKAKKPVKAKPTPWEKRPLLQKVILKEFERTPHGAEILRRGAKAGIAFLEEQRRLLEATGRENQSPKSGRKSTSSDEYEAEGVIVKSRSKEVSSMRHWGRIVKTALAGPLKEMAGPMAGDGRPPMPMIRAW